MSKTQPLDFGNGLKYGKNVSDKSCEILKRTDVENMDLIFSRPSQCNVLLSEIPFFNCIL